uniref:Transcriptional regulator, IclR family n=1 Tax=Chelativorans sp. (strain BNC1) TaxID=266779 RepID=Q11HX6_CHESB
MTVGGVKKSSTVLKALKMLEEIGNHEGGIALSDIASVVELDRSTAYRLLTTLVDAGFLVRSEETKKYGLTYKLISISRFLLANTGPDDLIRSKLAELSRLTQEAANFSVLDGDQAVIRLQSKGSHLLSVAFKIGDRSDLHCTSIGKVLLAQQSDRFIQRFLSRPLPKVTPQTLTNPDDLLRELEKIRQQGYAFDVREFADDMCCVAAPLFGAHGKLLGGINFAGPITRMSPERMRELAAILQKATKELSDAMRSSTPDD